jgi:hypothetical protein
VADAAGRQKLNDESAAGREWKFTTHASRNPHLASTGFVGFTPDGFATLIERDGSLGHRLQAVNDDRSPGAWGSPDMPVDQVRCVMASSAACPAVW